MKLKRKFLKIRGGNTGIQPRISNASWLDRARYGYSYARNHPTTAGFIRGAEQAISGYVSDKIHGGVTKLIENTTGVKSTVPRGVNNLFHNIKASTIYGATGVVTKSKYSEGVYKKGQKWKKTYADQSRGILGSGSVLATQGAQATGEFPLLDMPNLLPLFQDAVKSSGATLSMGSNYSQKLYIDYVSRNFRYTNACNQTLILDIYEIVAKRDTVGTATANTAGNSWVAGLDDQAPYNSMVLNGVATNTYGVTPQESQSFNWYYLIKQKFTVELPVGASHVHTSFYNVGKSIPYGIAQSSPSAGYVSGFTKGLMIVIKGFPVHDSAVEISVTTSAVKLDYIYDARVKYRFIPVATKVSGLTGSFGTVTTAEQWTNASIQDATVAS